MRREHRPRRGVKDVILRAADRGAPERRRLPTDYSDDADAKLRLRVRLNSVTTDNRFDTIHLAVRRLVQIEQFDGDDAALQCRDKTELADVRDFYGARFTISDPKLRGFTAREPDFKENVGRFLSHKSTTRQGHHGEHDEESSLHLLLLSTWSAGEMIDQCRGGVNNPSHRVFGAVGIHPVADADGVDSRQASLRRVSSTRLC